jgi:hypothetical protein
MADLIAKVVRANHLPNYSDSAELQDNHKNLKPQLDESFSNTRKTNYIAHISALEARGQRDSSIGILRDGTMVPDVGIQKTVSTVIGSKIEVTSPVSSVREFGSED